MTQRRFAGRTVLVTGASAGIGAACARGFASEGANLVLIARSAEPLARFAAELGPPSRVVTVAGDIAVDAVQDAAVAKAIDTFGALHVVVNNAGLNTRGAFEDFPPDAVGRVVDVNLRAPITLTSRALPHLRRAGGGAIVNVASIAGRVPLVHEAVYSSTKFAVRTFTMALAEELRGSGITVSAVSPGPVDTEFIMGDLDHVPDIVLSQPLVTAEHVAALVVACAVDGRVERATPRVSGVLATLGYVAPGVRRALRPLFERIGRRNKRRYAARRA